MAAEVEPVSEEVQAAIERAAAAIRTAPALLITAGSGLGVDSGLPDFRGNAGFWKAYPPFEQLGLSFSELANPIWFERDPQQAWGFYGHRYQLYRDAVPHAGYAILRRWGEARPAGYFVFTSNVDGQFQRAGFDPQRLLECHGSIHHLQCRGPCGEQTWPAGGLKLDVDPATFRCRPPFPQCPECGALARPNILMFGDGSWVNARKQEQAARYWRWLSDERSGRPLVVELGAGTAVPTVRAESERRAGLLVRINPRDPAIPPRAISIPLGACDALQRIDRLV